MAALGFGFFHLAPKPSLSLSNRTSLKDKEIKDSEQTKVEIMLFDIGD